MTASFDGCAQFLRCPGLAVDAHWHSLVVKLDEVLSGWVVDVFKVDGQMGRPVHFGRKALPRVAMGEFVGVLRD